MVSKFLPVPLLVIGALASCTTYTPRVEPIPQGTRSTPPESAGAAHTAEQAPAEAAKAPSEAELRKKSREVEYAKLQLEIARLEAENERKSAKQGVEGAERELAAAKAERDQFKKTGLAHELDERALSLDRAKQNVLEAEQELTELETMYKQEEFAGATKELVLTRGRSRLEMSKRDLELNQRRSDQLKNFELKKREKELGERVTKAQQALEEAKARAAKVELAQRLALMRSEHSLADAERELAASQAPAQ